jgi:hypothetical protein
MLTSTGPLPNHESAAQPIRDGTAISNATVMATVAQLAAIANGERSSGG